MKNLKLALIATVAILCFACGNKTDADFSIVPVKGTNGEYQYIDLTQKGKIVINPQFGEAHYFRDGLALVKVSGENGKWGYINKSGKFAIAPTYSMAQHFSEGVAWVQIEDQPPMLIDKNGKMLLQIDSITQTKLFAGGISMISVYSQGQELVKFIDKNGGNVIVTIESETIDQFLNDSLYAFKNNETEKWGFRNIKGEMVISPQFDGANTFVDGMAIVKIKGKWGVIDRKGNFIINPQYDGLTYDINGLFIAQVGKKYGWVNKKNEIVINPQYDDAMGFYGKKLAPIKMSNKWAYIDKEGQIAINPQFDEAFAFSGDYAMIKSGNKIGFINQKGEFIVPPLYESTSEYTNEYRNLVIGRSHNFLIDSKTKFLSYEKLENKKKSYEEMVLMELIAAIEKDPTPAIAELEESAKKWQDMVKEWQPYYISEKTESQFFSFESKYEYYSGCGGDACGGVGVVTWKAISKMKMGDCPIESVWIMNKSSDEGGTEWGNKFPPKCKSITPKIIANCKGSEWN